MKGFTKNPNSGVDPSRAGTYAGLVEKIPYLKELGITVVELMPIFQRDPQEGDYWGYMPLNFFAPHAQYASTLTTDEQHLEFRNMVKAFIKLTSAWCSMWFTTTRARATIGDRFTATRGSKRQLLHDVIGPGQPLRQLLRHWQYLEFQPGDTSARW